MGKSIQLIRSADHKADAPAHHSDEFPAGYSLAGCSPALPASASPAGAEYSSGLAQVRGIFNSERTNTETTEESADSESTLMAQFFCPKNGVRLKFFTLFWCQLPFIAIDVVHAFILPLLNS